MKNEINTKSNQQKWNNSVAQWVKALQLEFKGNWFKPNQALNHVYRPNLAIEIVKTQ